MTSATPPPRPCSPPSRAGGGALVVLLGETDWSDDVLAKIGTAAIPAVAQQLTDDEPIVRYRALGVLLRLYVTDQGSVAPILVQPEMVPTLIEARNEAGYGDDRDVDIAAVLTQIGRPAVEALAPLVSDSAWVGDLLLGMGEAAVPPLVSALVMDDFDEDYDTSMGVAKTLVRMQQSDPASVASLMSALEKEDLKFIAQHYIFYIVLNQAGSENALVRALNKYGNTKMCLVYLNCGNAKLDAGARKWAANHGWEVRSKSR